jgi:hypothetical protein
MMTITKINRHRPGGRGVNEPSNYGRHDGP